MDKLKFLNNPRLETNRLVLREISQDDAREIYNYCKNPNISRYVCWNTHQSITDTIKYINMILTKYENDEAGEWAIVLKESGKVIGTTGIFNYNSDFSLCEIGYAINEEYWNRGIATEVLIRLIKFIFEEMKINRIEARHFIDNKASGKVMMKANMQYEGCSRQKMFAKGKFYDIENYAILKQDYIKFTAK